MGKLPYWYNPSDGSVTWSVKEVLEGDGLEDLLASSQWCAAVVDPQAVEVRFDKEWRIGVYATAELCAEGDHEKTIGELHRGDVFVVLRNGFPKLGTERVQRVLFNTSIAYAALLARDGRELAIPIAPDWQKGGYDGVDLDELKARKEGKKIIDGNYEVIRDLFIGRDRFELAAPTRLSFGDPVKLSFLVGARALGK